MSDSITPQSPPYPDVATALANVSPAYLRVLSTLLRNLMQARERGDTSLAEHIALKLAHEFQLETMNCLPGEETDIELNSVAIKPASRSVA